MGSHFSGAVDRLDRQGLPRVSVGNHISARARSSYWRRRPRLMPESFCLEATHMMATIQAGPKLTAGELSHRVPVPIVEPRHLVAPSDHIDLSEAFTTRVPMLRSCPRFKRGRLRFSLGVALRERSRAKLARDAVAETRAWKLFGLIPMFLLHRPRHSGRT